MMSERRRCRRQCRRTSICTLDEKRNTIYQPCEFRCRICNRLYTLNMQCVLQLISFAEGILLDGGSRALCAIKMLKANRWSHRAEFRLSFLAFSFVHGLCVRCPTEISHAKRNVIKYSSQYDITSVDHSELYFLFCFSVCKFWRQLLANFKICLLFSVDSDVASTRNQYGFS